MCVFMSGTLIRIFLVCSLCYLPMQPLKNVATVVTFATTMVLVRLRDVSARLRTPETPVKSHFVRCRCSSGCI